MGIIKQFKEACDATIIEGPEVDPADHFFALFQAGKITRHEYHKAIIELLDSNTVPCTAPVRRDTMIKVDLKTMKCIN